MFTKECNNLSNTGKGQEQLDVSLSAEFFRGSYRDLLIPASNSGAAATRSVQPTVKETAVAIQRVQKRGLNCQWSRSGCGNDCCNNQRCGLYIMRVRDSSSPSTLMNTEYFPVKVRLEIRTYSSFPVPSYRIAPLQRVDKKMAGHDKKRQHFKGKCLR